MHAGLGFREFRLYASLAEAELNYPTKKGKAALVTVPNRTSEAWLDRYRVIVQAFIAALADDKLISPELHGED